MLRRWLAVACLMAVAFGGCRAKIKPSPYQKGLQAYYRSLISDSGEAGLYSAIADLDIELKKSPSDSGLLALRASGRLELVRLKVVGSAASPCTKTEPAGTEPVPCFDDALAGALFRDLRLLVNLAAQSEDHPAWLPSRIRTMAGDALLLKAASEKPSDDASVEERRQYALAALYTLAADFYIHAARQADSTLGSLGADKPRWEPSLKREMENAKDGYINSLHGIAQSENAVGLNDRAVGNLLAAQALLLGSAPDNSAVVFPPKSVEHIVSPNTLYADLHGLAATQARVLAQLKNREFLENVTGCLQDNSADCMKVTTSELDAAVKNREFALKEEIAARMFSDPIRSISQSNLAEDTRRLQTFARVRAKLPPPPGD